MIRIWRITELLLLVITVIAVLAFAALHKTYGPESVPLLLIAILCALGVYFVDKHVKRLTQPKPVTIPPDFQGPLKVYLTKKKLFWMAGVIVMFFSPISFLYEEGAIELAVGSGIIGLLFFIMFLRDFRSLGSPRLVLDSEGITTLEYGRIPWGEVDNVHLRVMDNRGIKTYVLDLSIYDVSKYRRRLALWRMLNIRKNAAPKQGELSIVLNMLSHEPRYIDAAVKHLRAQYSRRIGATPRTGDLSIDRKLSEADSLNALLKFDDDPEKNLATLRKIDRVMGEVNQEIQDNYKKARKETMILMAVFFLLVVFVVAIHVMGK